MAAIKSFKRNLENEDAAMAREDVLNQELIYGDPEKPMQPCEIASRQDEDMDIMSANDVRIGVDADQLRDIIASNSDKNNALVLQLVEAMRQEQKQFRDELESAKQTQTEKSGGILSNPLAAVALGAALTGGLGAGGMALYNSFSDSSETEKPAVVDAKEGEDTFITFRPFEDTTVKSKGVE